MILNFSSVQRFSYQIEQIRRGKVIRRTPWRHNMITDAGLDGIGSGTWGNLLAPVTTCSLGEGVSPTPVRRDSGVVNLSQSGTTVTASGSFFVAADVGRLIKFGSGSAGAECYVTAYTSATQVTVNTTATIAAQPATVWYVNRNQLDTPISLTWLGVESALCDSTRALASNVVTSTNTYVQTSNAFGTAKTVTEIGFGTTTGLGLYDRDIVSPSIAFLVGDQARVTVISTITYDVTPAIAVPNFGTGWNTAGTFQWEGFNSSAGIANNSGSAIPEIMPSGSIGGARVFGGAITNGSRLVNIITGPANLSLNAFSLSGNSPSRTLTDPTSQAAVAYGTGTRYRDKTHTWNTATGNGTIYGIQINPTNTAGYYYGALIFTAPQTKTNTQTLTITTRISWNRVLVN